MSKGKEIDKVSESNLFGTTKTSQSIGEARLVIKHSRSLTNQLLVDVHTELNLFSIESQKVRDPKYPNQTFKRCESNG